LLKLLDRVPQDYFDLQNVWKNKKNGTFGDFNGRTIAGVTFHRQFAMKRGKHFPLDNLFKTIDSELDAGRYVIVSLPSGSGWHMWVIVERTASGDYRAFSKYGDKTVEVADTKAQIRKKKGTDIMTYVASKDSGDTTQRLAGPR